MRALTKHKLGPVLTPMVELMAQGLTLKQIDTELQRVDGTTRSYMTRIRKKLNCQTNEVMMFRLGKGEL